MTVNNLMIGIEDIEEVLHKIIEEEIVQEIAGILINTLLQDKEKWWSKEDEEIADRDVETVIAAIDQIVIIDKEDINKIEREANIDKIIEDNQQDKAQWDENQFKNKENQYIDNNMTEEIAMIKDKEADKMKERNSIKDHTNKKDIHLKEKVVNFQDNLHNN
jgi:hypothetical protein